jgi:hypothetical protein
MTIMLPMYCGIYKRHFLVAAEQRGNVVSLIKNYAMPAVLSGVAELPDWYCTATNINTAASWRGCPFCGAYDTSRSGGSFAVWLCLRCKQHGNPGLNCVGRDANGHYHCSCGYVVTVFSSTPASNILVRGFTGRSVPQVASETLAVAYVATWRQ